MAKIAINVWRTILILILLLGVLVVGFRWMTPKQNEQDLYRIQKLSEDQNKKKVVLLMVDSLMSKSIDKGIKEKQLPAFQFLIKNGQYYKDVVTSFPTMSVTIDSTLLTGVGPDQHLIPGLIWYSLEENRIINYGTGNREVIKDGINQVVEDFIVNLNQHHLSQNVSTIYDDLTAINLKSGSINGLIYRGKVPHFLTFPAWLTAATSIPAKIKVTGPDFLSFGVFSNPLIKMKKLPVDIIKLMGFNNEYSFETLKHLIKTKRLPDFLYIYLPDMDQLIHDKGPNELSGVKKIDQELKSVLDSFGKWEKALDDVIFIIMGDSGQSEVLKLRKNPVILLNDYLKNYNVLASGQPITEETEVVLAVNERMAYIYPLYPFPSEKDIAEALIDEPRLDIIAWKEDEWIHVLRGGTNKKMVYSSKKDVTDKYKQKWQLAGDLEVLDIKVNRKNNTLKYGKYPNVLNRLLEALNSHQGEFLVVTAKPGYELVGDSSPTHIGGGSHGSLHESDSLIPLIISGTDKKPEYLRIEDLKPYIMKLIKPKIK